MNLVLSVKKNLELRTLEPSDAGNLFDLIRKIMLICDNGLAGLMTIKV